MKQLVVGVLLALGCFAVYFLSSSSPKAAAARCPTAPPTPNLPKPYARSIGTNRVLDGQDDRFSSFICFGGEAMECWSTQREFVPYDYTSRHCVFKNVQWARHGELVFYQNPDNAPLWDFDHGKARFDLRAQDYLEGFGVNITLATGPVPKRLERYPADTLVLAHEQANAQHHSVFTALQSMASTGMLALDAHVAVSSAHPQLSRYWAGMFANVSRWEALPERVLVRHAVLVPRRGSNLLMHEELARVFQQRVFYLSGIAVPTRTEMRIGLEIQPGHDFTRIQHQLRAKFPHAQLVPFGDFPSLRHELLAFSRLDMYVLLHPGYTGLGPAFLTTGSLAVLGHSCEGAEQQLAANCSSYAQLWSAFPQFSKRHLLVSTNTTFTMPPTTPA